MSTDNTELPTNDDFGNWAEVLGIAEYQSAEVSSAPTPEQIAEVTHFWADSPEGYASTDMVALMRLKDGRWAAVTAWCDTTGWDCQSGVDWTIVATRDEAISQGLDQSARRKLGLALPGEALS